MALPSIRGHQTSIKLYQDGGDLSIVNVTSIDINQESNFTKSFYVGASLPEGDQTIEGWSGTLDAEVKGPEVDELIDALVTQNLAGVGVSDYTIVHTENYSDGTTKTHVYFDVQMKMSKSARGLNEKVTKRLEWQAMGRLPV